MSVALTRAARAGIFVKNPDAFERLRHVETVLLDKTGTLTEGRATVARWHGDASVFELARALEAESSHAVARAFQASTARALQIVRTVHNVVEAPGQGIAGRVDTHDVRVGTRAFTSAPDHTLSLGVVGAAGAMVADGLSPVFVSIDGQVAGVAGIGDAVRPDAAATLASLRARGIHVRILSGDHPAIVSELGARLGLAPEEAQGGLSPEAKRDIVSGLVSRIDRTGTVVMVGDGVNDAAALALADVGVAVHGGTGASMMAADVVLTRDGVAPLLEVLDGARRLRGVIRRNITFSLFYNIAASSLAVAGLVSPLLAAVLMPISSLTVVLSSAMTRTFARARSTRTGAGA
jgi:Cu2+-exporting ATPase